MSYRGKKALLTATVLMICLSVFCSFFFIAELADHDCTHDDGCAICRTIAFCLDTLRSSAETSPVLQIVFAAIFLSFAVPLFAGTVINTDTLISLKVELRN